MALISGGILGLMWILGHDFSGHYNRLALISVDIINGVYCSSHYNRLALISVALISVVYCSQMRLL